MWSLANAILEGDFNQVHELLRYGTDLNQIDEYGFTPLIEAAIANYTEIARLLIEYGADVNLPDSTGGTALHWAAENSNAALCKLLLQAGANPNAYTLSGQPVLTMPFLRKQQGIKKLLYDAGANLDFAKDFINAKFLGHLYELIGTANIIDPYNAFVEVDFEGFFLEVTLAMIADSLAQFKMHFAGRKIRKYAQLTGIIIEVILRAAQIIKYQQYQIDIKQHKTEIDALLRQEPLIIPIGYEGHAITFVKFGNIFVKCDRREDSRLYDNVFFYQINNPRVLTLEFIKNLIYEKQSFDMINNDLPALLELQPITELKISAQISGNCSWANVEACIPVLFFLLFSNAADFSENIPRYKNLSLEFFDQWREWGKDRELQFCVQSFHSSDSVRKACKAEILAAILFQTCHEQTTQNRERAEMILRALSDPRYTYILKNYVKAYYYESQGEEGKNFLRMLQAHGYLDIG